MNIPQLANCYSVIEATSLLEAYKYVYLYRGAKWSMCYRDTDWHVKEFIKWKTEVPFQNISGHKIDHIAFQDSAIEYTTVNKENI